MNKSTMTIISLLSILAMPLRGTLKLLKGDVNQYSSGPKGIPHSLSRRHRPHAPNDGHWHMKFHRSRR